MFSTYVNVCMYMCADVPRHTREVRGQVVEVVSRLHVHPGEGPQVVRHGVEHPYPLSDLAGSEVINRAEFLCFLFS